MNMRWVLILSTVAVLVALSIAAFVFLPNRAEEPRTPGDPFGPSTGGGDYIEPERVSIVLADGSTARVPNFMSEQPEWASDETGYQVAGSEESAFHILFFEDGAGFLVSLLKEPLRDVRAQAEAELRSTLQLSDSELCKLNIDVAVARDVNDRFSGKNLGLSFCPGAIELP